jgi:adenosylcobinamide-phosphate synthase
VTSGAHALAAAVAADALFGEPPTALHPTGWMGRGLAAARARHGRRARSPGASLVAGALTLGAGVAASVVVARRAERGVGRLAGTAGAVAAGLLLKPALSLRALLAAGAAVERALGAGDLPGARRLLAWHLVSRDTAHLSASEVAGAAIESLAENLSDGFVAPALYHALGGVGAAYAYRLVNTADAMLGYRTPELEWFGKAAAHADDALNLVPARVTALLVALAAAAGTGSVRRALRVAGRDAGRTASPNAGWPMAAMAGALGVRLDKRRETPAARGAVGPGIGDYLYVLNATGRVPAVADLRRTRRVVAAAAALGAAACAGVTYYRGARGSS